MTKIKMLKSTPGALNGGLTVHIFKEGLIYPNNAILNLEGLDKIFLNIGVAEIYITPEEVIRHEKGLTGAPLNKRVEVPENKEIKIVNESSSDLPDEYFSENEDPDDGDDFFTFEELDGATAADIKKLALENNIDLADLPKNTSAKVLIKTYLERQGK